MTWIASADDHSAMCVHLHQQKILTQMTEKQNICVSITLLSHAYKIYMRFWKYL